MSGKPIGIALIHSRTLSLCINIRDLQKFKWHLVIHTEEFSNLYCIGVDDWTKVHRRSGSTSQNPDLAEIRAASARICGDFVGRKALRPASYQQPHFSAQGKLSNMPLDIIRDLDNFTMLLQVLLLTRLQGLRSPALRLTHV